ncbi:uncharacterized protein LOC143201427 [Rhynchophorus ferrugineus]|uniref:Uncharacterized protein n=1 Tax=Rhynchophorus ferrugineus TaxID=354439 RepID=A0A834MMC8_RHYFE|nr:hypothetical protein GWI33_022748 [Rhynchophorus ferrugineus]
MSSKMTSELNNEPEVRDVSMSQSNKPSSNDNTWIILGAVALVVCLLIILCICRRKKRIRRRRRKKQENLQSETNAPSEVHIVPIREQIRTAEDVTRRYERSVSSLSTKSQIYLVPFDALPPNFDFSSRDVDVRADYVILKDLSALNVPNSPVSNGVVNEAYEQQEAYNPTYVPQSSFHYPAIPKEYERQAPYNPNFY